MLWLLRLFPSYVQLEARASALEDQVTCLNSELHGVRAELAECLRKTTDAFSRMATGQNVFALASASPLEPARTGRVIPSRPLGRDLVRKISNDFLRSVDPPSDEDIAAEHDSLEELMRQTQQGA